ncbi:hypothetical protein [Streptomyces sp. NPDC006463]|uniref:hypothetical protein n=1 Tax=Streptomyces sp. NPDC006463 TaxID=3364746 RepID=UPI0036CB2359
MDQQTPPVSGSRPRRPRPPSRPAGEGVGPLRAREPQVPRRAVARLSYARATWDGCIDDLRRAFDARQRTALDADDRLGTQLEAHRNQIFLFAVLGEVTPAEARRLPALILSVDGPEVSVQEGNGGDVYSSFQISTENEPANWKFYLTQEAESRRN